jgi:hypothetical protein
MLVAPISLPRSAFAPVYSALDKAGSKTRRRYRVNVDAGLHSNGRLSLPNTTSFEVFAHSFVVWPMNVPCVMRLVPHAEALSETAVVYCDDAEFRGRADSLIAAIQRMSQLGQNAKNST